MIISTLFLLTCLRCLFYVPDGFNGLETLLSQWLFLYIQQLKCLICSSAWDGINGRQFDKRLENFFPCYLQSLLLVILNKIILLWLDSSLCPHCKDKIPKFRNKYSQKRNIGVSVPVSTFMRLWAIYIFPRSICLFCWRKYVDRSWDYINRSQTHECWNWSWGRAIPRKGIHKWNFRCSAENLDEKCL